MYREIKKERGIRHHMCFFGRHVAIQWICWFFLQPKNKSTLTIDKIHNFLHHSGVLGRCSEVIGGHSRARYWTGNGLMDLIVDRTCHVFLVVVGICYVMLICLQHVYIYIHVCKCTWIIDFMFASVLEHWIFFEVRYESFSPICMLCRVFHTVALLCTKNRRRDFLIAHAAFYAVTQEKSQCTKSMAGGESHGP